MTPQTLNALFLGNPELRRYAWLDISPIRLVLAPVILLLVLAMANVDGWDAKTAFNVGYYGFIFIVIGGGSYQIAQTVVSEHINGTWDWQRLSALTAGKLTSGKLIGGALYKWYGGLLLLGLMLYAAFDFGPDGVNFARPGDRAPEVVTLGITTNLIFNLILSALTAHGLTLFIGLIQAGRMSSKQTRFSALSIAIPGICYGFSAGFGALPALTTGMAINSVAGVLPGITWYGSTYGVAGFQFWSQVFFAFWAITAAYRLMRRHLQYDDTILAFVAFLLTFTAYWSGFGVESMSDFRADPLAYLVNQSVPLSVCIIGSYFAAPFEALQTTRYPRWWADMNARAWERLLYTTPLWVVSYVILAMFCLGRIIFAPGDATISTGSFYFPMLLFILRDMIVLHILVMMRNNKRALPAFGLYLFMIYIGVPFILKDAIATHEFSASLFFPLPAKDSGQFLSHLVPIMFQCTVGGLYLWSRWQERQQKLDSGK